MQRMWPVTTKDAAAALRTSPQTLRRWIKEKRFAELPEPEWDRAGFQRRRLFTREWIVAAAAILGIEPDFEAVEVGAGGD